MSDLLYHNSKGRDRIEEVWRSIKEKGYEHFVVSNYGRVLNTKTGHCMTPHDNGRGYLAYQLKTKQKTIHRYAHRLVARAFLDTWDETLEVNHIDKNKQNNRVDNLEMATPHENKIHSREEYVDGHIKTQGRRILVYSLDGTLVDTAFGIYKYCRDHNHDTRSVQRVLAGAMKYHHGLVFTYADTE